MKSVETIKIYPAIGIARIGNSPNEYFIGPEIPGVHRKPKGGYKDSNGRIKRQAARFRLFGYDKKGKLLGEITSQNADIEWEVHLANKKAAWHRFEGLKKNADFRNKHVHDRESLMIDPGPRKISGPNQSALFDTGSFLGKKVPLGEIRIDRQGRLLVLGGFGKSASPSKAPLPEFANNDNWYDDVSDGPVNAKVTMNGKTFAAIGSWVVAPPPDYVPPITSIITLYDTLLQVAVDRLGVKLPSKPSFTNDIYPLLQRALNMRWVNELKKMAEHKRIHAMSGSNTDPEHGHQDANWGKLLPPPGSKTARAFIFGKLRDPALPYNQVSQNDSDMPMIWSDYYMEGRNQPLTKIQYEIMTKWKDGIFINDWGSSQKEVVTITPEGLNRAALETCVGAAFYPGIETGWLLRDSYAFIEPFRLDGSKLKPGDITKQMALPWQADFTDCQQDGDYAWWPAQRPDDVFPEAGGGQVKWLRNLINSKEDMIKKWYRLGFIVKKGKKYVETERS